MPKVFKHILIWIISLTGALIILSGRYSWAADRFPYSLLGYIDSAFMLTFTLPTTYYLSKKIVRVRFLPEIFTLILALILILPYHWLGLEKYQYSPFYAYPFQGVDLAQFPSFAKNLQAGLGDLWQVIPSILPFLLFLLLLGLVISAICTFTIRTRIFKSRSLDLLFWFGIFVVIIFETWIHLSARSPLLARRFVDQTPLQNWYIVALFPGNKGVMMADYHFWRDLEAHFMGSPFNPTLILIRRSYLFYLTSQFSYFISPYYVYITRNIILWFGASFSMFLLAKRITSQTGSAIFTALFTAMGSGFILYSAEAPANLAGYAIIPIVLLIFFKIIDAEDQTVGHYLLFGTFLGLASQVYDFFPWYLAILAIAWVMKKPMAKVLMSLGVSVLIYIGFLLVQTKILGFEMANQNSDFITNSLVNIFNYVFHFNIKLLYLLTLRGFDLYFYTLAAVFLVIPIFIALAGFTFIKEKRILLFLLIFWAPSFIIFAVFLYGNLNWIDAPFVGLPRLHFINFLWVYIADGICLNGIWEKLKTKRWEFLSYAIPIVIIIFMFLLSNADTVGWHQLYSVMDW